MPDWDYYYYHYYVVFFSRANLFRHWSGHFSIVSLTEHLCIWRIPRNHVFNIFRNKNYEMSCGSLIFYAIIFLFFSKLVYKNVECYIWVRMCNIDLRKIEYSHVLNQYISVPWNLEEHFKILWICFFTCFNCASVFEKFSLYLVYLVLNGSVIFDCDAF